MLSAEAMHDERLIRAMEEKESAINRIRSCLKAEGNAEYYLKQLPIYLKMLEDAYERQLMIEAELETEAKK